MQLVRGRLNPYFDDNVSGTGLFEKIFNFQSFMPASYPSRDFEECYKYGTKVQ